MARKLEKEFPIIFSAQISMLLFSISLIFSTLIFFHILDYAVVVCTEPSFRVLIFPFLCFCSIRPHNSVTIQASFLYLRSDINALQASIASIPGSNTTRANWRQCRVRAPLKKCVFWRWREFFLLDFDEENPGESEPWSGSSK